ncbi:hypothetical protein ACEE90_03450 [Corynebacterium phoceense]
MTTPGIIFNQQVEVRVPGLIDSPYSSEPIEDWENPDWKKVEFLCSVQDSSTVEGDVNRPQVTTRAFLVTPPGTDIPELSSGSVIRVGGVMELSVAGKPARWPDPWTPGTVHHLEAELEVVDG